MLRLTLRFVVLLVALASNAGAGNIALVLSDTAGPYAEFSSTLAEALPDNTWKITFSGKPENLNLAGKPIDLIVTAGSEAFLQALNQPVTVPLIATLLPRQTYEKILTEAGKGRNRVTAIYLDQPARRQASSLRRQQNNEKLRVGMLLSNEPSSLIAAYTQTLRQSGMRLESEEIAGNPQLIPALNNLLPKVDVLLALPDNTIYKRDNVKAILVTTYRYKRPLIGFSHAFVNAGALASLYSTPAQIARQTAELISNSSNALPGPMPPSQFAISINPSVADALDLNIPDEASIRRAMLADQGSR